MLSTTSTLTERNVGRISRRDFLTKTALATCALSRLPAVLTRPHVRLERRGQPKRVVIVGAGLAGLTAAYELVQAGHDVTVLEAQTRAGGRVLTLRAPFGEGLYADAGATRIPDNHEWTLRYAQMFGLPLDPFQPVDLATVYHLRGKRQVAAPGASIDPPYALAAKERTAGLPAVVRDVLQGALDEVGDPTRPGWPPPSLRAYDELSYDQFLSSRGVSADGIEFQRALNGGYNLGGVSVLWVLRNRFWRQKTQRYWKITGGNDRLPDAFATRLAERIRYGAEVVRIEKDEHTARVTYVQAGSPHSADADRVVCAVPLPLLRQIVVPGLSDEKRRAIREIPHFNCTKVFLQMRRPFWTAQGLSGFALTDLPVQEVWSVAHGQRSSRGILLAYMNGENALHMAGKPESERIRATLASMERVFPGAHEHFEGAATKSWDQDPWVRGANAYFKPGQMTTLYGVVGRAEGRIHFAGEHTSVWTNWMQGALESGRRVAEEVNSPD